MKKACLFLLVFFVSLIDADAQLTINSSGKAKFSNNVAIGTNINDSASLCIEKNNYKSYPYFGIKSHIKTASSMPTNSVCGVLGFADAANTHSSSYSISPLVGVLGKAYKPQEHLATFSAGVAGLANYYHGIGVYGAIPTSSTMNLPTSSFGSSYAGYFSGNVKVTATLTAAAVTTTSDLRLKDNIHNIQGDMFEGISFLQPVSYKFRADSTQFVYLDGAKEMETDHYGFIAQDVQKIFPNLVYEDGKGMLSINYIELIPLLVGKINALSGKVEALESELSHSSKIQKLPASNSLVSAKLYQNNPNPFNQLTVISYELPLETQQAVIYIYDMTGTQIDAVNITDFGSGSITLTAGKLQAGMYLYSLIADGKVIDTKQMILTK